MDPTVLKAFVAGGFTVLGIVIGWLFKERRFKAQRFREREKSFERAQEGYRPCYRKFTINLAAAHGVGKGFKEDGETMAVDFSVLRENFFEARGCNDPVVVTELDEFWPREILERGDIPTMKSVPASLDAAMRDHGSRSLEEHDALLAKHKR